jgi:type I restriction enzyme S subunit
MKSEFLQKLLEGKKVEWRTLGEVTYWDKRFNGVDKNIQPTVLNFKHVSAEILKSIKIKNGNIKLLSTGNFEGYTTEEIAIDNINEGEVITIPTGGTANIKYYKGKFVDSGNLLGTARNGTSTKYIYYFLMNVNNIIESFFRGSGVKHPDMKQILQIPIPIPPMEVQKEVVRILDLLTSHTTELKDELNKELTARKKQYEYYRNKLLTFGEGEAEWRTLGEVASLITKGTTPKSYVENGISFIKTESFSGTTIDKSKLSYIDNNIHQTFLKRSILEVNDILFTIAGATIGKSVIVTSEFLPANTNQALAIIRLSNLIDTKYIFHILQSNYMKSYIEICVKGSAQPNLNLQQINKFKIPIPPLSKQQEIVEVLDKFDALTNSITEGLPREIELRQKQYEYYRNLLLNYEK